MDARRALPSVDELLRRPELEGLWQGLGPGGARVVIRGVLDRARREAIVPDLDALEIVLRDAAAERQRPTLRRVINATGVLLHTNLGRAPLPAAAVAAVAEEAAGYCSLELDLSTGRRGKRDRHVTGLVAELTGAERSLVVNNNAAAVLLALHTLAIDPQGEVLVSRGEMVEIGESFRIGDIAARGGARVVEVGATNRTRIADYQAALTPRTRLVLRVHRSNFVMAGFVEQPTRAELAAWARTACLPLVEDLGSGALTRIPGLPPEPTVRECLQAGVDLVTYSGDKLLGGPQAGLISGRAELVDKLRADPLYRALRVGKLTLAALEATLRLHARQAWAELPVAAMAAAADLEKRSGALAARLPADCQATIEAGESLLGGGATPGDVLPGWVVAIAPEFEACLRHHDPPILTRVEHDRCRIDLRAVTPAEENEIVAALAGVTRHGART